MLAGVRRTSSPWLLPVVLAVVGVALGFLGARLANLEVDARAKDDRAHLQEVLASVPKSLQMQLTSPSEPPLRTWQLVSGYQPVPLDEGERLRLDEAEWRFTHGEPDVARRSWQAIEATGSRGARSLAALRLAAALRREDPGRAKELLERLANVPGTWAEQGVPLSLGAAWLAAEIERERWPGQMSARRQLLQLSGHGLLLGPSNMVGPDALLLAAPPPSSKGGPLDPGIERELEAARRVAREGRQWRERLGDHLELAVSGSLAVWRRGDAIQTRPVKALLDPVAKASGADLRLLGVNTAPSAEALVTPALPPPLSLFRVEATPPHLERGWTIHIPWVVGLGVYLLGAVVALLAFRRHARAARMQGDFVAAVSHELKTPIASVRAMAELLADGVADDPQRTRTYAERIENEMTRLGTTVRNILDASRVEQTGELALARVAQDPARLVEDVVAGVRPLMERRGFRVELDVQAAERLALLDGAALRSVLVNLLDNAMKFAGPGRTVRVVGRSEVDGRYRIEVVDDGVGLPPGDPERLFRRFHRGAGAKEAAIPGIGLGLFVARQVVEAHGGTIHAEDVPQGGARFVVVLPPAREEARA